METINEMDSWRSVIHFGGPGDKRKDPQPVPVDMSARFYSYAVEWSLDSINCEWRGDAALTPLPAGWLAARAN